MSYYKNKKITRPGSKVKERELKTYITNLKNACAQNNVKASQMPHELSRVGVSRVSPFTSYI